MLHRSNFVFLLSPLLPLVLYLYTNTIVAIGPTLFWVLLAQNTPISGERGITCIPTAVLAQAGMLVLQHGSYQDKGKQGFIVSVPLRKTRENVFFSTCEAGEKQYDHTFSISSRRNQHLKEFLGKEKSPLEKLRPLPVP